MRRLLSRWHPGAVALLTTNRYPNQIERKTPVREFQRGTRSPPRATGSEEGRRLRGAFHVFSRIEEADGAEVARAWFLGMDSSWTTTRVEWRAAGNARAVLATARFHVNA